jgi:hypothetical protein
MMTTTIWKTTTNIRLFRKLEDDIVNNNKVVSSLEIRETTLEDDEIDPIVNILSKGSVTKIHLEDCSAHLNKSAVRLVEALGNCRDVRLSEYTFVSRFFLDVFLESATRTKNLRIRDYLLVEQVEALSRGLKSNKVLHTLDLSRSRIDDFSVLAEGLMGGSAKRLKLRSIGLRDSQLATLMTALESSLPPSSQSQSSQPSSSANTAATAVESLDLSFNRLRNLECIGDLLKRQDCNLKELLIGYQNLWQSSRIGTNMDVSEIASALTFNRRLTILKLTRNELTDSDAILFAVALEKNTTLEILDLRDNKIADDGVAALAKAARNSRGLKQLQLRGNPFGTRASLALLEAASNNFDLTFFGDNGRELDNAINSQIRYHTALNRGGRKILLEEPPVPLALWPLILEKQASPLDWEGTDEKHPQVDKIGFGMCTNVLYYFIKDNSTFWA